MNIKEHIEAGHYPKDEKGRALVPMKNGRVVTIYATEFAGGPIAGADGDDLEHWRENGHYHTEGGGYSGLDLLPPPPRKVEVKAWVLLDQHGEINHFQTLPGLPPLIELTGSYEEEWT